INGWGWAVDDLYIQQAPTATEPTTNKTNVSVYPNPTTGKVTVSYTITATTNVTVVVYDLSGRVVTQKSLGQKIPGSYENELLISDKPGQYVLQVQTDFKKEVVKVVVN
ncbi:MAG TPA: T9SS type A sorting domain-containing protein, partial [Cyclobacteriaceae bacterium]|nr:T9SS type A sorting domain-containing protein [Cyclobacteriaceae bacterium]